jgi:transposase InsO family protein
MPWKQVQVSEERLRFAIEASKPSVCLAELCRQYGISRQTGYLWSARYQEGGVSAVLEERSRRPHSTPREAALEVVQAVVAARQQRPDWGARKLGPVIRANQPDLPAVSRSTIQRILERQQLIDPRDRRQTALQRFERSRPNELWQMDFKGPQGFNKRSGPLSIQDDYSRYLLALRQLSENTTAQVKRVLEATFTECGLPEWLLLDHGKPWYDFVNQWGWTELTVWIMRQGIRITFCRVRHPQTQGKIERMHGALQKAIGKRKAAGGEQDWLDEFRGEYNHVRPHEGIGMVVPASRWEASPRQYDSKMPDWEYPSEWLVQRLGGEGQLRYAGKRWQISGALRKEAVGLAVNDGRALVYYCNMPVRELDLAKGTSTPLPGNPFRQSFSSSAASAC